MIHDDEQSTQIHFKEYIIVIAEFYMLKGVLRETKLIKGENFK